MTTDRSVAEWKDLGGRFQRGEMRDFGEQYCRLYQRRLGTMRPWLVEAAKQRWSASLPVRKTAELKMGEECVLVGVIVKHQRLRPSVLKAIAKGMGEPEQPIYDSYCEDDDSLGLEDEIQPISLGGRILKPKELITGVVVALRGSEAEDHSGAFIVKEILFPPPQAKPILPPLETDTFVLLLSGLKFVGPSRVEAGAEASLELLLDWITGVACDEEEIQSTTSRIVRVIIAGGLIGATEEEADLTQLVRKLTQSRKAEPPTAEGVRDADAFLARLARHVPVDVMPGITDPTNWMLPQRPLSSRLFPKVAAAGVMGNLHLVSNPYDCSIAGRRFLGTSGQNIDDLYRFAAPESPMTLLELTHRCQHLAPGAPDTLAAAPAASVDPFLFGDPKDPAPSVLFAGCQRGSFKRRRLGETEAVVVPSFADSPTAVLINLRNLAATPIAFAANTFV